MPTAQRREELERLDDASEKFLDPDVLVAFLTNCGETISKLQALGIGRKEAIRLAIAGLTHEDVKAMTEPEVRTALQKITNWIGAKGVIEAIRKQVTDAGIFGGDDQA